MILSEIAAYLASTTNKQFGTNVFFEAIPPIPDQVIVVREPKEGGYILPQLECDLRNIQIVVRDKSASAALELANLCHKALAYQSGDMNNEPTGIIQIAQTTVCNVALQGNPRFDEIDDKGRRLYKFSANIITQRKY